MTACRNFKQTSLPRRSLLKIGGLGMLGLTMPGLLQAAEQRQTIKAKAKSVIFLFQFGGPSHLETFDMKPAAPDGIRGEFKPISSNVPGMPVCEHLPEMAKVMDKVTLVHSMHHDMKNHNSAAYYALTGRAPPLDDIRLRDSIDLFPCYGSVASRCLPAATEMPAFVAYPHVMRDGIVTAGQRATFLGKAHDPLLVTQDPNADGFGLPELSLPGGLSLERLQNRRELQQLIDSQAKLADYSAEVRGMDDYYTRALGMLHTNKVRQAFDLSHEPKKLRDAYGRTTYGQSCLLARRLVEAGVKFVNVYYSDSIGGQAFSGGGWDTHGFNNTHQFPILKANQLPITDTTLPVFLKDMDDRGLLNDTLVVWMGEFGRTPKVNVQASRDHWPGCYTVLLAGGGVKRGFTYGASDKTGSYPARDPVRPDDLAATMFYALGIDPMTEIRDSANRPWTLAAGKPIHDIFS